MQRAKAHVSDTVLALKGAVLLCFAISPRRPVHVTRSLDVSWFRNHFVWWWALHGTWEAFVNVCAKMALPCVRGVEGDISLHFVQKDELITLLLLNIARRWNNQACKQNDISSTLTFRAESKMTCFKFAKIIFTWHQRFVLSPFFFRISTACIHVRYCRFLKMCYVV